MNKEKHSHATKCPPSCFHSSLWRNVPFIIHCFMMVGLQSCIQTIMIFVPSFAGQELGSSTSQEAWILGIFGLSDLVGRFFFGFVFDIKPIRKRRLPMYIAVSMAFAFFTLVTAFCQDYAGLVVVIIFSAFFEGGAHSQRTTIVPNYVEPDQMSIAVGMCFLFMGIGNFFGPTAGGSLRDVTESFRTSFILTGSIYLIICSVNVCYNLILWSRERKSTAKQSVEFHEDMQSNRISEEKNP